MKKIITISREFGAGGGQIGKAVANRLGYYYMDKDVIIRSAMESASLTAEDFRHPLFFENGDEGFAARTRGFGLAVVAAGAACEARAH